MVQESFGWLSDALKWPSLIIFGVIDIALTTTIIILTAKSTTEHGFVTIPSPKTSPEQTGTFRLDIGILWTTLPNLAFALFAAHWAWIACAIAERQPYVELRKDGGAAAKKSIMLDYRVNPVVFRWWTAFRKSHKSIGSMTLLSVLLTYVTAPLAARLFATQVVLVPSTFPITYDKEFSGRNMDASIDWRPILNTVSATLLYEGRSIPWTNDQYAFRPFSNRSTLPASAIIEATSTAFTSHVDCKVVKDYAIESDKDSGSGEAVVHVSGKDRGCEFTQKLGVAGTRKTYLKTTSVIDCSAEASYSRLVFTFGKYSSLASNFLDDVSVISCATGYRQVDGTLKVSSLNNSPIVQSFEETGYPDVDRPPNWRVFEDAIVDPATLNPKDTSSTSEMGSLILSYAQRLQSGTELTSEVLIKAISIIFTRIYLNSVAFHGFTSMSEPATSMGKAFVPTTRLVVVEWVAYVIVVFLLIALCFLIWAFFYVHKQPSILTEEPQGLLSAAALVHDSDLIRIVSNIRKDPAFDGHLRQSSKRQSEIKDKKWTAAKGDERGQWVISSI
ncbi:unnamed protein product [Fusarium equiseti]|uniref:Uncharacterized protein n=1 Tax=Fusarium equiseti TaxID=61235 RepID=A0A8J2NFP6_FUSEQ|nr:unnamed protein product [Fusarium equiseti]